MEFFAGHQSGDRAEGDDVALRSVLRHIEHAFANAEATQVGQARQVGLGAPQADQAQRGLGGQALNQRVFRRADKEGGV